MAFKQQHYSGICMCGHKFEDHHLGMVCNEEAYKVLGAYYAQECEYFGCNEDGGLDEKGEPHCSQYVDREDPDEETKLRWSGTVREEKDQ